MGTWGATRRGPQWTSPAPVATIVGRRRATPSSPQTGSIGTTMIPATLLDLLLNTSFVRSAAFRTHPRVPPLMQPRYAKENSVSVIRWLVCHCRQDLFCRHPNAANMLKSFHAPCPLLQSKGKCYPSWPSVPRPSHCWDSRSWGSCSLSTSRSTGCRPHHPSNLRKSLPPAHRPVRLHLLRRK